jgi:hypothetical protein
MVEEGVIAGTEIVLADYSIRLIEDIKEGDHLLGGGRVIRSINCSKSDGYDTLASLGENLFGRGLHIRTSHPIMLDNGAWVMPTNRFHAVFAKAPELYTIELDGSDFYYAGGYRVSAAGAIASSK